MILALGREGDDHRDQLGLYSESLFQNKMKLEGKCNQEWKCTPIIPALKRWRQEDMSSEPPGVTY